jgi:hypothetical protein
MDLRSIGLLTGKALAGREVSRNCRRRNPQSAAIGRAEIGLGRKLYLPVVVERRRGGGTTRVPRTRELPGDSGLPDRPTRFNGRLRELVGGETKRTQYMTQVLREPTRPWGWPVIQVSTVSQRVSPPDSNS